MAPALKYGLLAVAGMVAWMLAEFMLGLHGTYIGIGHYTSRGAELILVLALWRLHHHQVYADNRYWLPVWVALLHGLLACVVAALGLYVFLNFYLHFLNPFFPDRYLEWLVAGMRSDHVPEELIREKARVFRWSYGTLGLPIVTFSTCLFIGLVASPLLTLWLNWRRKEVVQAG